MTRKDPEIDALLGSPEAKEPRKYKELGDLHDLLLRACPPDVNGNRSIPVLAKHLEMSSWGVFKWIKNNRLPPRQAAKIVELSHGEVALEDFIPYIFK